MLPDFSKNFAKQAMPKGVAEAINQPASRAPKQKHRTDIRTVLAWTVFGITILAIGAVYGGSFYFDREIKRIELRIEEQEVTVQPRTISELILFNEQIETRKSLDISRIGYINLIETLAGSIVPSVRFSSLAISLKDAVYSVKVDAVAETLLAYLQQERVFSLSEDPIIDKVQIDSYTIRQNDSGENVVVFSFTLEVPVSTTVSSSEEEPIP